MTRSIAIGNVVTIGIACVTNMAATRSGPGRPGSPAAPRSPGPSSGEDVVRSVTRGSIGRRRTARPDHGRVSSTGRRRSRSGPSATAPIVAGLLFTAYLFIVLAPQQPTVGFDAFAYWSVNSSAPSSCRRAASRPSTTRRRSRGSSASSGDSSGASFLWVWLASPACGTISVPPRPRLRGSSWLLAVPAGRIWSLYHGNIDLVIAAACPRIPLSMDVGASSCSPR